MLVAHANEDTRVWKVKVNADHLLISVDKSDCSGMSAVQLSII